MSDGAGLGIRPLAAIGLASLLGLLAAHGAGAPDAPGGGSARASAGGTWILHTSNLRDAGIFAVRPDGRDRRRLRGGLVDAVAASRDGWRIAFARDRSTPCSRCAAGFFTDVLVADGQAERARLVKRIRGASVESIALSPDGRLIALALYRGAGADLYLMSAGGKGLRRLTRGPADEAGPAFSPDGRRIAFSRELTRVDLFSMRVRGGGLRRLTRSPASDSDPTYSPDGRLIVFSRGNSRKGGLAAMRRGSGKPRWIATHGGGRVDIDPDFSPDGRRVVFARGSGNRFDLYVTSLAGGGTRRIAHAGIGLIDPDWTRRP